MIVLEDLNVTDKVFVISEDASYIVDSGSGDTKTEVYITMKEHVTAIDSYTDVSFTFNSNGVGDDTLVRTSGTSNKYGGKWSDGKFTVGMNLTVTGTVSNDGVYVITGVTDDTITVATGSFTQETIIIMPQSTLIAAIPDTDWFLYEDVTGNQIYTVMDMSPTALRFKKVSGSDIVRVWVRT